MISLDVTRTLAYVHADGQVEHFAEDGSPVDLGSTISAKLICIAADDGHLLAEMEAHDSEVSYLVPSLDIDDDRIVDITAAFYVGTPITAILSSADPIPTTTLEYVIEYVGDHLATAVSKDERVDLARKMTWISVPMLRSRIRATEESVRQALADDDLTDDDYRVLRLYPQRLAHVERLALNLREEPQWTSFRTKSRYELGFPVVAAADMSYWRGMQAVGDDARAAVSRMSGLLSSQAVVLAQRQQQDTERFQRLVTLVGAAVLVPGLVAAVFGANVGFRGRNTISGFWALLAFMAASAIGTYALLRLAELGALSWLTQRGPVTAFMRQPATVRAAVSFGLALLLVAAGVLVTWDAPNG